jgi:hypothetical protein
MGHQPLVRYADAIFYRGRLESACIGLTICLIKAITIYMLFLLELMLRLLSSVSEVSFSIQEVAVQFLLVFIVVEVILMDQPTILLEIIR